MAVQVLQEGGGEDKKVELEFCEEEDQNGKNKRRRREGRSRRGRKEGRVGGFEEAALEKFTTLGRVDLMRAERST